MNAISSTQPATFRAAAAALVAACLSAAVVGCGSAGSAPPAASPTSHRFPDTAVGRQASWLLGAAAQPPIPATAISGHFDATFLAQAPAAKLNSVFASVRSLKLDSVTKSTASTRRFVVTADGTSQLNVSMATDSHGLISGLLLQPTTSAT